MIKYNVTVRVEQAIVSEWVSWMKNEHIPQVMETGIFTQHEFSELIDPTDPESEAITFTIQYWCPSIDELNRYFSDHAPALRKQTGNKYGEQCLAFRSVMKEV